MENNDLIEDLADHVYDLSYHDLDNSIVDIVKKCFIDTIGVSIAGADTSTSINITEAIKSDNSDGVVIGNNINPNIKDAIFLNSTFAHMLDFDDSSRKTISHPSATMVPLILALSKNNKISGKDAIVSYVAGFEVQYYLSLPINPSHYELGWHTTSTLGTFGSAAVCGKLLNLDKSQIRNSLNIAASMASGTHENFGTETKPIHSGHAAMCGYNASSLAKNGLTASPSAITGSKGFFQLYSNKNDNYKSIEVQNNILGIEHDELEFKKYPCCFASHTSIEAIFDIISEIDFDYTDIKCVEIKASKRHLDVLVDEYPKSSSEARFSISYIVSKAILTNNIGLETFEEDSLNDEKTKQLAEKVILKEDTSLNYNDFDTCVKITLKRNKVYKKEMVNRPGTPEDPLSNEDILNKLESCVSYNENTQITFEHLYNSINKIQQFDDIEKLPIN